MRIFSIDKHGSKKLKDLYNKLSDIHKKLCLVEDQYYELLSKEEEEYYEPHANLCMYCGR